MDGGPLIQILVALFVIGLSAFVYKKYFSPDDGSTVVQEEEQAPAAKGKPKGRRKRKGAKPKPKATAHAAKSTRAGKAPGQKRHPFQKSSLAGHTKDVIQAKFSPDGRSVATVSEDGSARVWATGGNHPWLRIYEPLDEPCAVAFSPDGKQLALAMKRSRKIAFYSMRWSKKKDASGEHYPRGEKEEGRDIETKHTDDIKSLLVASGGMSITCTDGNDTSIRGFGRDGKNIFERNNKQMGNIMLAMSDNSKLVAAAAKYGDPKVLQLVVKGSSTPQVVMRLCGHERGTTCIAFGPGTKRTVTGSIDGVLRLFKTDVDYEGGGDAKLLYTKKSAFKSIRLLQICPVGDLMAASSGTHIHFYRVSTGELLYEINNAHKVDVASLEFSPDGNLLLSAGGPSVRIWSVDSILKSIKT